MPLALALLGPPDPMVTSPAGGLLPSEPPTRSCLTRTVGLAEREPFRSPVAALGISRRSPASPVVSPSGPDPRTSLEGLRSPVSVSVSVSGRVAGGSILRRLLAWSDGLAEGLL